MNKKYEITSDFIIWYGRKLFRIKALVAFGNVSAGELGGYIEKEENLNAEVCGDAWVYGDAKVYGDAEVCGNAKVYGDAKVYGNAEVCGDAWVYGNAEVCGDAEVLKPTHLLQIGLIGSRNAVTTFFRVKTNKIHVVCGCFYGDINEFEKRVSEVHAGTKHETTYKIAIQLAKAQIELDAE